MPEIKWNDYGESSLTLLAVHCGMDKQDPAIPFDPADFQRCIHLFDCLRLDDACRRELLLQTAIKYPKWKLIYENWDLLLHAFNIRTDKTRPELFDLLQKYRKEPIVLPKIPRVGDRIDDDHVIAQVFEHDKHYDVVLLNQITRNTQSMRKMKHD